MSMKPPYKRYESPNIVIVPTISFISPPKKLKLDNESSPKEVKPQTEIVEQNTPSPKACINNTVTTVTSTVTKCSQKDNNDDNKISTSKPKKSWASNYLQSIGQNRRPIKGSSTKDVTCYEDRSKLAKLHLLNKTDTHNKEKLNTTKPKNIDPDLPSNSDKVNQSAKPAHVLDDDIINIEEYIEKKYRSASCDYNDTNKYIADDVKESHNDADVNNLNRPTKSWAQRLYDSNAQTLSNAKFGNKDKIKNRVTSISKITTHEIKYGKMLTSNIKNMVAEDSLKNNMDCDSKHINNIEVDESIIEIDLDESDKNELHQILDKTNDTIDKEDTSYKKSIPSTCMLKTDETITCIVNTGNSRDMGSKLICNGNSTSPNIKTMEQADFDNTLLHNTDLRSKIRTYDESLNKYIEKNTQNKFTVPNEVKNQNAVSQTETKTPNVIKLVLEVTFNNNDSCMYDSDKNECENPLSANEDLSFLDDFNVDEIVECLNYSDKRTEITQSSNIPTLEQNIGNNLIGNMNDINCNFMLCDKNKASDCNSEIILIGENHALSCNDAPKICNDYVACSKVPAFDVKLHLNNTDSCKEQYRQEDVNNLNNNLLDVSLNTKSAKVTASHRIIMKKDVDINANLADQNCATGGLQKEEMNTESSENDSNKPPIITIDEKEIKKLENKVVDTTSSMEVDSKIEKLIVSRTSNHNDDDQVSNNISEENEAALDNCINLNKSCTVEIDEQTDATDILTNLKINIENADGNDQTTTNLDNKTCGEQVNAKTLVTESDTKTATSKDTSLISKTTATNRSPKSVHYIDPHANFKEFISELNTLSFISRILPQKMERAINFFGVKYTATSVIHSGKFSKIFHCNDESGHDYALKIIPIKNNELSWCKAKKRMLMQLQERTPRDKLNCVRIIDIVGISGNWCIMMDHYPQNLREALAKHNKSFHISTVQILAKQIIEALNALRLNSIVHSDINPNHILLNATNSRLKLCGFDRSFYGNSKILRPDTGIINYRAPEVILGHSTSYPIDIWSAALVLYEMGTNRTLFNGFSNHDILFIQLKTLGDIRECMLNECRYRDRYFVDSAFIWKDYVGQDELIEGFEKSSRLYKSIFAAYFRDWAWNSTEEQKVSEIAKIKPFHKMLQQMLVLNPFYRASIECLKNHKFIIN